MDDVTNMNVGNVLPRKDDGSWEMVIPVGVGVMERSDVGNTLAFSGVGSRVVEI